MGKVRHISPSSKYMAGKLNESIQDDQNRGSDGNESKDEDYRVRIEDGEHQEHSVDSSRGTHKDDICSGKIVTEEADNATKQTSQEIEQEILLAPYPTLNHRAKDEKAQHVEQQMTESSMHKHIGEGLPEISTQHQGRYHCKIVGKPWVDHRCDEIHQDVDDNQLECNIFIGSIPESPVQNSALFHRHTVYREGDNVN